MSIKILRTGTLEYQNKLSALKEKQLKLELMRWRNLTHHEETSSAVLLEHYHNVQQRNINEGTSATSANSLCADIKSLKPNLVALQGNMKLSHLEDLLD